jgi:hypothetical protein
MVWTAPAPASGSIESCAKMVVLEQPSEGAPSMGKSITDLSSVTTVGLDLAKHVFQVHCVDAALANLSGQWIDRVHARRPPRGVTLDIDSSVSPTHGEQEMSVWNGH